MRVPAANTKVQPVSYAWTPVYERSVLHKQRQIYQEPAGDPAIVAQAIARILPGMIQDAEEAGLTIVADHLTRTLNAAEVGSAEQESPLGRIE